MLPDFQSGVVAAAIAVGIIVVSVAAVMTPVPPFNFGQGIRPVVMPFLQGIRFVLGELLFLHHFGEEVVHLVGV